MKRSAGNLRRVDPRDAVRRDGSRLSRREQGHRTFWRSLGLIGTVGWPIALGAAGGAFAGRQLDRAWHTGIRFTLMLLALGLLLGSIAAWNSITHQHE